MKRATVAFLLVAGWAMLVAVSAFADGTVITIDEFTGNCNHETGCTVILPFAPTSGQVLLSDMVSGVVVPLDVVTFKVNTQGQGSYTYASDNVDGFDAPGDTFGPPLPVENRITLPEPVNENGVEMVTYTPVPGQPGFVTGQQVTYHILSDSHVVPEPATLVLLCSGLAAVGGWARRRRV